jgi:hypothetical protein
MEMHLHDNNRHADEHLPLGEYRFDAIFASPEKQRLILTLEPHFAEHLEPSLLALQKYRKGRGQREKEVGDEEKLSRFLKGFRPIPLNRGKAWFMPRISPGRFPRAFQKLLFLPHFCRGFPRNRGRIATAHRRGKPVLPMGAHPLKVGLAVDHPPLGRGFVGRGTGPASSRF